MHQLLNIGVYLAAVTSADLSEPSTLWLAIICFALILLRRRPFARSKRHPAVSEMLSGIANAKEQILAPLKRLQRRSAQTKTPAQGWMWMGLEGLEGRQLMSSSPPSPASPPPAQMGVAIEESQEDSATKSASSTPTQKNRDCDKVG
jgi:hypothetical protein